MTATRLMVVLVTILGFWLFPSPAYAYLDPGTGSYIFQIIIAGVLGIAFLIKVYWSKIKTLFFKVFSRDEDLDQDA